MNSLWPVSQRIRHLRVESCQESLDQFLSLQLQIDSQMIRELFKLGAIYINRSRCTEDQPLTPGDLLRVHLQPRRFPKANSTHWNSVILEVTKDYYVVNKPTGVPVHATLDNAVENLLTQLSVCRNEKLFVTQRLDIETTGVIVIARTEEFQSYFNRELARQRVKKWYEARVHGQPNCREWVHYMAPGKTAPRRMGAIELPGWKKCRLEIVEVKAEETHSVVRIRLHTGRTHQIRAQMAAIGHPLVGDTLYGSKEPEAAIELKACETAFTDLSGEQRQYRL